MVRITEELVRKRSEHNELEICTLEELSLHQEDIEKIEHLQNWCKDLQILLLQGNLISRLENLHKLKKLQYLNLAINNIEVIENLEGCESLEKLDLTLNFIGDLKSVCSLKHNIHLKDLYLTGNPCTDYNGYRSYVIAKLPQLNNLDNHEITRSERLKALQIADESEKLIEIDQEKYLISRKEQRERISHTNTDEVPDEIFWKQKSEHCPEVRVEMSKRQRRAKGKDEAEEKETKPVRLFTNDGRPLNLNHAKVKFQLLDEDPLEIVLDLEVYKFLDTELIHVDVHPTYVTVIIKSKYFQIVLPEEVSTTRSVAQRSQTTGHLVIRMPRSNPRQVTAKKVEPLKLEDTSIQEKKQRREYLEIGGEDILSEICNLVESNKNKPKFEDNPEVPPLE